MKLPKHSIVFDRYMTQLRRRYGNMSAEVVIPQDPPEELLSLDASGAIVAPAKSSSRNWWDWKAVRASAVIGFGEGETLQKAKEICEVLKIPFQASPIQNELDASCTGDPGKAWLVELKTGKDPAFEFLAKVRKQKDGMVRRVILSLPSTDQQLFKRAYALSPSGIWLPPHSPQSLASLLLLPRKLGG